MTTIDTGICPPSGEAEGWVVQSPDKSPIRGTWDYYGAMHNPDALIPLRQ